MLFPKKTKRRKWQRNRIKAAARLRPDTRGLTVSFGSHGLKAMSPAEVTSNQIEAARRAAQRELGKLGRLWIRIFPDRPRTAKGSEVPMGAGKGELQGYIFEVHPGRIIFEVDGVTDAVAREALRKANTKLPISARVVTRV
ncbi:MAG: ribosomal protein large subunit ribosomal protein [Candidatus Parcubacteria bacterium]|jgi:large subunit ribosomal protein L16